MAAGVLLALLDRLQDQRFFLRAHPFQVAQPPAARACSELVDAW